MSDIRFSQVEGVNPPPVNSRLCEECDRPIPAKRLAAVPGATRCVPCLERNGDVPRYRRLDEYVGKEGEDVVQTLFTTNPYLMDAVRKGFSPVITPDPVPLEEGNA